MTRPPAYARQNYAKPRSSSSQQCARVRTIKKRGNKCEQCGYPGSVELHHIIEIINGGTHDDENLILLCEKCHADAHGKKKPHYVDERRQYWTPR